MIASPTTSRIKTKCRITSGAFDTDIATLASEITPVVEFASRPEVLASTDAGLVATLDLAVTEIICAELLEERVRDEGALSGSIPADSGTLVLRTADRLRHRGWARLRPFLRTYVESGPIRV